MANKITLFIPDELLRDFKDKFPEINVAELSRRVISKKIKELKGLEELNIKGKI
ncbi:MAG: hypothetical protein AABX11_06285 [Nanoarchaeota archaeon]